MPCCLCSPCLLAVVTLVPPDAPNFTSEQWNDIAYDWVAISSTLAQTQTPALFQQIVADHNAYRAMHGAPPLVWGTTLQQSATRVANKCNFSHDPTLMVGE
jgi:uncharacterized protein YkwD